jgi:hypothetical protein
MDTEQMLFRRHRVTSWALPTLRDMKADYEPSLLHRSGADVAVRARLDEFRQMFRDQGARLTGLRDPLAAVSVGASLSAPFLSITDLRGLPAKIVLDAVADEDTAVARAALLALAAATDGRVEGLAESAAARLDPRIEEPPWARWARQPLRSFTVDRLLDRDDSSIGALVVTVRQVRYRACFFLRFYRDSLITEKILFIPQVRRSVLMAELVRGGELAYPYRFTRRLQVAEDRDSLVSLVKSVLETNEHNLRIGVSHPPYPPNLSHLARVRDVSVVPALLVLLRKLLGSAYGFAEWTHIDDGMSIWN